MTNLLKDINELAAKFNHDELKIATELKRIQSIKCRLKKQKGKSTYEQEMTECIKYEQALKEARQLINPKEKTVTTFTAEDIKLLDYDETIKAIRSIQSKKSLSKWLTTAENDNDEYRKAVEIENMLIAHKATVQPVDNQHIRKTELITIVETIESSGNLKQEQIIEMLKGLLH